MIKLSSVTYLNHHKRILIYDKDRFLSLGNHDANRILLVNSKKVKQSLYSVCISRVMDFCIQNLFSLMKITININTGICQYLHKVEKGKDEDIPNSNMQCCSGEYMVVYGIYSLLSF
jgi:hypothetical protein